MAMNAILVEILVGHRQLAVIIAAVMRQLDLNPRNYPVRRLAEFPIGWAFQHFYKPRRPLARYGVAALHPGLLPCGQPGFPHGRRPVATQRGKSWASVPRRFPHRSPGGLAYAANV